MKFKEKFVNELYTQVWDKKFKDFLKACGVVYKIIGWDQEDLIWQKLLDAADEERNVYLKDAQVVDMYQSQYFTENAYGYVLRDHFNGLIQDVDAQIVEAYENAKSLVTDRFPTKEEFIAALPEEWKITDDKKRQGILIEVFNKSNPDKELQFDQAIIASVKSNTGGIDLTSYKAFQIKTDANGEISVVFDSKTLELLENVQGFRPVIVSIRPIKDLPQFLGIT